MRAGRAEQAWLAPPLRQPEYTGDWRTRQSKGKLINQQGAGGGRLLGADGPRAEVSGAAERRARKRGDPPAQRACDLPPTDLMAKSAAYIDMRLARLRTLCV